MLRYLIVIAVICIDCQFILAQTPEVYFSQKLLSPDPEFQAGFGSEVMMEKDYVLISEAWRNFGQGVVYLFKKDAAGDLIFEGALEPDSWVNDDAFGSSVAMHNQSIIVGAPNRNGADTAGNYLSSEGAAYIFSQDVNGDWSQMAELDPTDTRWGRGLGFAIDINDQYAAATAIRGDSVPGKTSTVGGAYLYRKDSQGAWIPEAKLLPGLYDPGSLFGSGIVLHGSTCLVSDYKGSYDSVGNYSFYCGSISVFNKDSVGVWKETQLITPPDFGFGVARFGYSMQIHENTMIVGAPWSNMANAQGDTILGSGAAYIYSLNPVTDRWDFEQRLLAPDMDIADNFGSAVAISDSLLVVGAKQDEDDDTDTNEVYHTGSAYVFKLNPNGNWDFLKKLYENHRQEEDYFGSAAAINGEDIIVGAYNHDFDQNNQPLPGGAGAAFWFKYGVPTGITAQIQQYSGSVYPNPSNGDVSVQLGRVYNQVVVRVFNGQGVKCHGQVLPRVDHVDLSLPCNSGLHIIQVEADDHRYSFKVVLE